MKIVIKIFKLITPILIVLILSYQNCSQNIVPHSRPPESKISSIAFLQSQEKGLSIALSESQRTEANNIFIQVNPNFSSQNPDTIAFAKALVSFYHFLSLINLSSAEDIGYQISDPTNLVSYLNSFKNKFYDSSIVFATQTKLDVLPALILERALVLTKLQLSTQEKVAFASQYQTTLLDGTSELEVLDLAVFSCVYEKIKRDSQYTISPEEDLQLKSWIQTNLQAQIPPLEIANAGVNHFIIYRAVKLGYVPIDPTYLKDINNIVKPKLASGKSADQIVGELTVGVELTCATSSSKLDSRTNTDITVPLTLPSLIKQPSAQKLQPKSLNKMNQLLKKIRTQALIEGNTDLLTIERSDEIYYDPNKEYILTLRIIPREVSMEYIETQLRQMSPSLQILHRTQGVQTSILVMGLDTSTGKELFRRGFEISENSEVEFHSLATCPSTKYTSSFLTMSSVREAVSATHLHQLNILGDTSKIAILDSGIEATHPDFGCTSLTDPRCRIQPGTSSTSLLDELGHGTHVASIASGNSGIAPKARVHFYKISTAYSVIDALNALPIKSPHVVNMSFSSSKKELIPQINDLVDQLTTQHKITFVAATGNCDYTGSIATCSGPNAQGVINPTNGEYVVGAPAGAVRAIAVASSSLTHRWASLISLPGPHTLSTFSVAKPDLMAPGQLICAAAAQPLESKYGCTDTWVANKAGFFGYCSTNQALLSGSSMSSPVVAGGVALLAQYKPEWNPDEIKSALKITAKKDTGLTKAQFREGAGLLQLKDASLIKGYPPVLRIEKVTYQTGRVAGATVKGAIYDRDAGTQGFKEYRVFIGGSTNPTSWKLLKTFKRQVGSFTSSDVLFSTFEIPSCFPPGEYLFKIEVEDFSNQVASDFALIKIN